MNIHSIYGPILRHFRRGRMRRMWSICSLKENTKVIDIGGTVFNWELARELGLPVPRVTIVNLSDPPADLPRGIAWLVASACDLKRFADREFDLAVSNSVIEHLHKSRNATRDGLRGSPRRPRLLDTDPGPPLPGRTPLPHPVYSLVRTGHTEAVSAFYHLGPSDQPDA